jgi:hypothetical protein
VTFADEAANQVARHQSRADETTLSFCVHILLGKPSNSNALIRANDGCDFNVQTVKDISCAFWTNLIKNRTLSN